MKKIVLTLFLTMGTAMMGFAQEKGAFETGKYRNVFVEMGYKPADVDAKLKEVFYDVFRGPNKVYFEVGDTMV